MIWYGTDSGRDQLEETKSTDAGNPYDPVRSSNYRDYNGGNPWYRNGGDFDYEMIIYGYDDRTHAWHNQDGAPIGDNRTYYWDWVYKPNGYYTDDEYSFTDIYMFDNNTNQKTFFGRLQYQLRGNVFYDPNGGDGSAINKIMDINMDIIRTDIPDLTRTNPTRNGYTFLGWSKTANSNQVYTRWNWKPQKDLKLYAQWMWNSKTL